MKITFDDGKCFLINEPQKPCPSPIIHIYLSLLKIIFFLIILKLYHVLFDQIQLIYLFYGK